MMDSGSRVVQFQKEGSMQTQLKITLLDLPQSEALAARIHEKVAHMEKRFARLTACHVIVSEPHRHRSTHRLYAIRINVALPGVNLTVRRDDKEDVYVLLQEAFAAAERDIEKALARRGAQNDRRADTANATALTEGAAL